MEWLKSDFLYFYADFSLGRCKNANQKHYRQNSVNKKQSIPLLLSALLSGNFSDIDPVKDCPRSVLLPSAYNFLRLAFVSIEDPKVAWNFQDFILMTLLFKRARKVCDVYFLLRFNFWHVWHRCIKQSKTPETSGKWLHEYGIFHDEFQTYFVPFQLKRSVTWRRRADKGEKNI